MSDENAVLDRRRDGVRHHAGSGADLSVQRRQSQCRDDRERADQSLGPRVPARRADARHRAAGTAAHRRARRQAVSRGRGRAAGARVGPGRIARRRARPPVRRQQDDLFLLRRAGLRRRAHRDGARQAERRRSAEARRRQGDLPPGRAAVERQPLRLPHRAGTRRQSVAHDGRSLQPARRGAEPRQPHRQDRARHARRRGAARTTRSSTARTPSRRSGATVTAIHKAPRCIRRPANCGSTSTARAAATRSTFRSPEKTTAGR